MAREVNAVLGRILAENRGITEAKAEEIVKNMRAANQYQVCFDNLFFFFSYKQTFPSRFCRLACYTSLFANGVLSSDIPHPSKAKC